MSRFASGVTVVTARNGADRVGLTASSFASVSMEPPLVLVCVTRTLHAHAVIEAAGAFAVNVLGVNQLDAALRFAGLKPELPDRFEGLGWTDGATGSPLLQGCLASFECRLHAAHEGGDHTIFVGQVVQATAMDGEPLVYHNRLWHRPEALTSQAPPDESGGM